MLPLHIRRMPYSPRKSIFHAGAIALSLLAGAHARGDATLAVNSHAAGLKAEHDFSEVKLRGYGTLSGKAWSDGAGGSLLEIDCQNAEHARLLQAKYLSDLGELPPATQPGTIQVNGAGITIATADEVGAVAALRSGATVVLAAAPSGDALAKLITSGVKGSAAKWTSVAEGAVPMYLDRFDKYGFRFYYAPGNLPPKPDGSGDDTSYDVREDFNWMQSVHGGVTLWTNGLEGITPEWLSVQPRWNWTVGMAKQKGLPFGVNLGIDGAAYWYFNRNPDSMMQFAPDFLGTYYGSMNFGIPEYVSWSSPTGQDMMLAQLQQTVRNLASTDNITSWLEPHEELGGGEADLLVDYGPQADNTFRQYLKEKYKTIGAVSKRYQNTALTSWDQVHAPEPAEFLGWSKDAVDLAGTWKISYDAANNADALGAGFDDSKWGEMNGPGYGLARLLPQKPAVWRRHFNLAAKWQGKHPAIWLYVWDMNDTRGGETDPAQLVSVSVNGKPQPETQPAYTDAHWAAYDVTKNVQGGDNVLAVRLPRGLFNYRVYLSGDAPKSYPQLGDGKNAQWVDFSSWLSWNRGKGVGRGMQMIRQADPNRGIVLMAPDSYENEIIQDAIKYGGDFHNTGYMGGWWCDKEPALMRGAGLPFSTEPSQGPTLPQHIMGEMGNWITESVNAIDHFQTLGEVLYHPDLKKTFENHAAMYTSIGKWHAPVAQIAALYSSHTNDLLGWPWAAHPAVAANGQPYFRGGSYPSGFNCRGFYSPMENMPPGPNVYESDAVNDGMLDRDQANNYRIIVDTDTAVMDESTLNGIERFVRQGGVFVTYGETGRHSPEKPDSWPISRLTGCVLANETTGGPGTITLAGNQTVFAPGTTLPGDMDGHRFKAVAKDVQNVLMWNDGNLAVGLRPLGKGFIVTVGPWLNGPNGNAFMSGLFQWLKIDPVPAHMETLGNILWRHYLSNNGLYDVWAIWNKDSKAPTQGTLILDAPLRPGWSIDLKTGNRNSVVDGRMSVNLAPFELSMLITPRAGIAEAPSEWLALQRGWWQGTAPTGAPMPKANLKMITDLTDGWSFLPLAEQQDAKADLAATVDDSAWKKVSLGLFSLPDNPDVRHAVVRRQIQVPAKWKKGEVTLFLPNFRDGSSLYLDGQPAQRPIMLAAGSTHMLAVEIRSQSDLLGADGPAWLSYHPDPGAKQDLGGMYQVSTDFMNWPGTLALPGSVIQGTRALRTSVVVDKAAAGKTVVFHATERSAELHGIVINGKYVAPGGEGSERNYNITPWVLPGKKNDLVLMMGGSPEDIASISLEFYTPGTYP
jgi:hypothetical protein